MYKIMISVRNRLAITTKCIAAITKHSTIPHEIYVYDNCTSYLVNEHFMYWSLLYQKGIIKQLVINTKESTFNAFSKAVAFNQFLMNHEQDPDKDKYDFLLLLDNDIIVFPGFDKVLKDAWTDVKKYNLNNIKIITQLPGGIMSKKELGEKIAGFHAKTGKCGGSGFWALQPNFAREIGCLDILPLVGLNKKHDQNYWTKLEKFSKGKDYILGLDAQLALHMGAISGSICNTLTRNKNKSTEELIKFEESEKHINSLSFDQFFESIKKDKEKYRW